MNIRRQRALIHTFIFSLLFVQSTTAQGDTYCQQSGNRESGGYQCGCKTTKMDSGSRSISDAPRGPDWNLDGTTGGWHINAERMSGNNPWFQFNRVDIINKGGWFTIFYWSRDTSYSEAYYIDGDTPIRLDQVYTMGTAEKNDPEVDSWTGLPRDRVRHKF